MQIAFKDHFLDIDTVYTGEYGVWSFSTKTRTSHRGKGNACGHITRKELYRMLVILVPGSIFRAP